MTKTSNEKKIMVLNYSLNLEKIASLSLAFILDIENIEESKSLGNKSSSLSFNQKINLLLDNKSIDENEKIKLDFFMSIRNQFMHNLNVNSFTEAYSLLTGVEKKLRLFFPEEFANNIDIEISLEKCTEKLFVDSIKTLASFKGAKEKKVALISKKKIYEKLFKNTPIAIDQALKELKEAILNNEFNYKDKNELIENINILKQQIIVYQSTIESSI